MCDNCEKLDVVPLAAYETCTCPLDNKGWEMWYCMTVDGPFYEFRLNGYDTSKVPVDCPHKLKHKRYRLEPKLDKV